jgi:hypothetical protein
LYRQSAEFYDQYVINAEGGICAETEWDEEVP